MTLPFRLALGAPPQPRTTHSMGHTEAAILHSPAAHIRARAHKYVTVLALALARGDKVLLAAITVGPELLPVSVQAQRSGVAVDTSRRTGVGNSNIASTGLSAAKLDNETEELKREHARTRDHTRTRAPLTRTRAPPPRAHASTRTNTYGHIRTSAHTCTRARTREGLVHEAR
eukprot:1562421-Pleurochrysis_carterae.AAC.8